MKIYDLKICVEGLELQDDENIEDFIDKIRDAISKDYNLSYEISSEEQL